MSSGTEYNNGSIKQNVVSNISAMLSARIINIFCGVAVSILLARYLGAERQGTISYALSIYGMFSFIAVFGLPDIILREFSRNREESEGTARSAMLLMLFGGVLAFVLSVCVALQLRVTPQVLLFVILYSTENISQFLRVFEQWLYSIAKTKSFSISQIIIHILFLILKVVGVALKQDMIWFVMCTVLEMTITNASLLICYRVVNQRFLGPKRITIEKINTLLKSSWPLIIVSAANTIYMRIDQIMIGKMVDETNLGVYSVGVTLAEYWYFVPSIIYTSFLPSLAEKKIDDARYYYLLQRFADCITTISYIAIVGFAVCGRFLIPMLYGAEYSNSSVVLFIYIWAGLFVSMSYVDQITYIIMDNTKIILIISMVSAGINIVINMLLIPILGIYGAALATTLDQVIIRMIVILFCWRKYKNTYIVQIKALIPFRRILGYFRRKAI